MDVELPARWADEPTRLAAVRTTRELSTSVEPVLANIVRIAAEAVRAPMAMLTLVEAERVRTIVRHNIGVLQLPRAASPCARVVGDRAPLQIPDLLADPRYAVGPLTAADSGARSYTGVPLHDTAGNVVGALSVLDHKPGVLGPERAQLLGLLADQATAILALGANARRSAAEAAAFGRFGSDFISLITHEVRTPVAVITGNLELLDESDDDVPPQHRERMVTAIRRNADRLVRLIDHLLVTARAGDTLAATVHRSPVDLASVVGDAVRACDARARQTGVALDVQVEPPHGVAGDGTMLRTAIDNLLSNALLFTPPGGRITVRVGPGTTADGQAAVVTVTDTGVGIPEDELPRVFERFFRGAHAQQVEAPGAGLGLAVTEAIAVAHDGVVQLDSTPGLGTTVRLVLPLEPEEPRRAEEMPRPVQVAESTGRFLAWSLPGSS
ncbi:GAF domain-containing sensor histidine kinase [Cryptosporangium aurantiacum]|uniref:histidine kinase n=1 Tax=Cryptosporangium aurantiacum TaxID=134849 RepID=A0A1M7RN90_9ACTN|nr:GAF domain-containing sensor histidine kinase [Cryptosporangium aurantiacum]SHN47542.1 GAF domain-containing protein [Cryptosporangium aurantiacum]